MHVSVDHVPLSWGVTEPSVEITASPNLLGQLPTQNSKGDSFPHEPDHGNKSFLALLQENSYFYFSQQGAGRKREAKCECV